MAYTIVKENNKYANNYKEFVADAASDLDTLLEENDVSIGSTAIVTSTSTVYILDNNKEWVTL